MKKLLSFLFFCSVALIAVAGDFEVDDIYYRVISNSSTEHTCVVTYRDDGRRDGFSYINTISQYKGHLIIPSSVTRKKQVGYHYDDDGKIIYEYDYISYTVVGIDSHAFQSCFDLMSVTIPSSVTSIGSSAFEGCSSLTSLTIPSSVTSIGSSAFEHCSSLTSLTIPSGVTEISDNFFYGCSSLANISIPSGVEHIGNSAFYGCSSLTNISIPSGVKDIGFSAFQGCSSLTSVTIPSCVTRILSNVFYGCSSLTNISIPSGVEYIGSSAFEGCSSLAVELSLPANLKSIGDRAFYGLNGLTGDLTFPDGLTDIGKEAFSNCSSLTSVTIPEGVKSIGNSAFEGCSGLTGTLTIPSSVTSIGNSAFYNCSSLTSLTTHERVKDIGEILERVTSIGSNAFQNCSSLTSVTLPPDLTSIGWSAFSGCTSLKSVTYAGSPSHNWNGGHVAIDMPNLGGSAFEGCSSLTNVSLPEGCAWGIGERAFSDCCNLETVGAGCSLFCVGDYAFERCNNLTRVNCYGQETSNYNYEYDSPYYDFYDAIDALPCVGKFAFDGCINLTEMTMPTNGLSIGECAFRNCSNWTGELEITYEMYSIGDYAFYKCSGLTGELEIPSTVMSIGKFAFCDCSGMRSIVLAPGWDDSEFVEIGISAFAGCDSIQSFEIHKNISGIENLMSPPSCDCFIVGEEVSSIRFSKELSAYIKEMRSMDETGYFMTMRANKLIWLCEYYPEISDGFIFKGDLIYVTDEEMGNMLNEKAVNAGLGESDIRVYPMLGFMFTVDGICYVPVNKKEGTCAVIDCDYGYNVDHLTISNTVECLNRNTWKMEEYRPIVVNDYAFYSRDDFRYGHNIKELTIDFDGEIEKKAFLDCHLTNVKTTEHATSIGGFSDCKTLKSVTISENVTNIEDGLFENSSSSLESIIVGQGNKVYDSRDSCNAIIETATNTLIRGCKNTVIPSGVMKIGDRAFFNCDSLLSVMIPEGVTSIGNDAFRGCKSLTSVMIPEGVTSIGEYAFGYCSSLTSVTIPEGVTSIGEYAFGYCSSLTSVTIPEGVTSIGNQAFNSCHELASVIIPSSVTNIGEGAFAFCDKLQDVTNYSSTPQLLIANSFTFTHFCTLHVLPGCKEAYSKANYWKNFTIVEDAVIEQEPGDLNGDGEIDITDIVAVISYILDEAPEGFDADAADVNKDGNIDIIDIVSIIDLILSDGSAASAPLRQRVAALAAAAAGFTSLDIVPFGIEQGTTTATVTLDLQNPNDAFTAFECNIRLPEDIDWATTTDSRGNVGYVQPTFNTAAARTDDNYHTLTKVKKMDDGTFKLMCYSMTKDVFLGETGALIDLPLVFADDIDEDIYDIEVSGMVLVRADVTVEKPTDYKASVIVGEPTMKQAAVNGYLTAEALDMVSAHLGGNASLCSLDMSGAVAVDGTTDLNLANPNAVIYVAEGMSVKNENNVVEGDVCANLVLTDGKPFGPAKTFTVKSGEYGRTLSADEYATIVLPFAPDAETLKGYMFYELTGVEENALTFDEVTSPVAGKPYIVTSDGTATKLTAESESEVTIEAAATEVDGWTMTGTYESVVFTDAAELANLYCISGNQFKQATSKLTMNPFRAYFVGDGSAKSITLHGNDGTTRIISLNSPFSILNSPLYDLQGRQVEHAAQGGIYIQNGKKVLVK